MSGELPFTGDYTRYQLRRSFVRKFVRRAYLRSAARKLVGPTLDFGCGVGELLTRLPTGSRGVEYNRDTVAYCQRNGLPVDFYDGVTDDWSLGSIAQSGQFQSMVVSHVLEHLDAPAAILSKLLRAADDKGMQRVLVIVPGAAGFRTDPTHTVFVDYGLLAGEQVQLPSGWRRSPPHYFPINLQRFGDVLTHHELQVVFSKRVT